MNAARMMLVDVLRDTGRASEALLSLDGDAVSRERMGERARAALEERGLTWEATARAYGNLYEEIAR